MLLKLFKTGWILFGWQWQLADNVQIILLRVIVVVVMWTLIY